MHQSWMTIFAAAVVTVIGSAAQGGIYIPVPMVPGAVSEIVFDINNDNLVAGSFRDAANVEHGFFGPLDGSNWTTFDFPGDGTTGTEARYIGDDGSITGTATNPAFTIGEEFYRAADETFSVFQKDGQPLDGIAQGINSDGTSVGDYINAQGETVGYIGQSGSYKKDFKLHISGNGKFRQVSPRGIFNTSPNSIEVGFFFDGQGLSHGFWQTQSPLGAKGQVFDYPNAVKGTSLQDTNGHDTFSGQWRDAADNTHAFIVRYGRKQNAIIDLDPMDGSVSQYAWGENDRGLVAVSTSNGKSFVYCRKEKPEHCPTGTSSSLIGSPASHKSPRRPV